MLMRSSAACGELARIFTRWCCLASTLTNAGGHKIDEMVDLALSTWCFLLLNSVEDAEVSRLWSGEGTLAVVRVLRHELPLRQCYRPRKLAPVREDHGLDVNPKPSG